MIISLPKLKRPYVTNAHKTFFFVHPYPIVNIQNKEEEKKSPSPRRRQAMSVER
jgi:hypothetical protein